MEYKTCTKCNKIKEAKLLNFHTKKNGKYGLNSKCKDCVCIENKIYRSKPENKIKHKLNQREWVKKNYEKSKSINNKSREKNKENINRKRREKYHNDPIFKQKCKDIEKEYKDSGRRYEVGSTPEQREKSRKRSKERRKNPVKKQMDYEFNAKWREENKDYIKLKGSEKIKNLDNSYVASSMRKKVSELTPEAIETKRIIIQLKRELKNNNIKIR